MSDAWSQAAARPASQRDSGAFSKLGLSHNPFPAVGIPSQAPIFSPAPSIQDQLLRVLTEFEVNGIGAAVTLIGDYGSGKTFTLRSIERFLLGTIGDHDSHDRRTKVVYVSSAGSEFYAVLRKLLDSFGIDEVTKTVWKIVLEEFTERESNSPGWLATNLAGVKNVTPQLSLMPPTASVFNVPEDAFTDYRLFLAWFRRNRLSDKLLKQQAILILAQRLNCTRLIAAELVDLTDDDILKAQVSWDRLTVDGERGAPYKAESEAKTMDFLLLLAKETGNYDRLALLIDEFESTVSSSVAARQRETYQRTLRLVTDTSTVADFPLLIVLAVHPEAWTTSNRLYPALGERYTRIPLPMVNSEWGRSLVMDYLQSARPSNYTGPAEFPFDKDSLELLVTQFPGKRSPRRLLTIARRIIDQATTYTSDALPLSKDAVAQLLGELEG